MTRKDYQLIASALAYVRPFADDIQRQTAVGLCWLHAVEKLAEKLKADNPKFDRARFEAACHV